MSDRRFDLVGIGDLDVDIYVRVPRLPGHDEKVHGVPMGIFAGGMIGNVCCAAARLGLRTGMVAVVGEDVFGAQTVAGLEAFGVDTTGVRVRADQQTYFCVVQIDDSGEKALTLARTPAIFPQEEDLDPAVIGDARLVHIAPFDIGVAVVAALMAKDAGGLVSVDLEPGTVSEGRAAVARLLEHTDVCVVNDFGLTELLGPGDLHERAEELRRWGPSVVVVTRGARGATAVGADGPVSVPGHPTTAVDTTGAGDAFNAAFLGAWLEGWPLERAVRLGCAAGAISTRAVGPRSRLPTRDEALLLANGDWDAPSRIEEDTWTA